MILLSKEMILVFPHFAKYNKPFIFNEESQKWFITQSKNVDSNKKLLYQNIRAMLINKTEHEVCAHACN